ncbi:hypothetical protein D3C75_881540 [compost metagenome]
MNKKSEEFLRKMLEFLPSTDAVYRESITLHGEVLETVIIEDIFMPEIIKLLKEERNINLLEIILETARKYMGTKTFQLQIEADRALGRI